MERRSFFAHVLLLIAMAIYSAEAGSCYFGRAACVASCKVQNCATGYCASRDSICRCSRCGTGSSSVLPVLGNPADIQWRKSPGIQQDAGAVQPAHPKLEETMSISQNVDVEQLMAVLNDEKIMKRFRELNFDIITIREIIFEGWGSNPKEFSNDFGILRKYVATKEEGLELLEELEDIFSELLGQETKKALENILLYNVKPCPDCHDNDRFKRQFQPCPDCHDNDRFKRQFQPCPDCHDNDRFKRQFQTDPIQLGGGFYFDIIPPSIGLSSGGFDVNLNYIPDVSFGGGSLNIGGKLSLTIRF